MFKENNFFATNWNSNGRFDNDLLDNGDGTLTDRATGLMWQQGGSKGYRHFNNPKEYVEQLNYVGFAGHRDWRLPTLEEAASLLQPKQRKKGLQMLLGSFSADGGLYINPLFDDTQRWIWSSDAKGSGAVWGVCFDYGYANWSDTGYDYYVRVCRAAGH
jgi:hypothetical protein